MSIYSMGWNAGVEAGEKAGRESLWVEFVCKKLRKGKNVEMIAEEMEEDEEMIRQICELAGPFAPDYPSNDIAELWMEKRKEILV